MIDINSPTFIPDFKMEDATVGQIGYGFIGNSVIELFRPFCKVLVYDKAGYGNRSAPPNVTLSTTIDQVVHDCEVIFVAVPTPMKPSGECHTGIVESVIQDIQNAAIKIGKALDKFIVVIKSTVPPGFTTSMQDKYALRIIFSPEFLTEANAVQDFKRTNRVILGGDVEDARVLFKYFEGVWPDRQGAASTHPDGPVYTIQCEPEVAEMTKLSTNVHLTAKVMISNEIYLICEKLGIKYDDVKTLTQFDRRIGTSHMNVPGPDGKKAVSGSCFPKDLKSLGFISEQLGCSQPRDVCNVPGSTSLFRDIFDRIAIIRGDKDWEQLTGRAVIDD